MTQRTETEAKNQFQLGDIVSLSNGRIGYISGIQDVNGTPIYHVDLGLMLKFPAKAE